ncbi:ATP-dependent helicase HrpB [Dermabacter vaginalis]|uniref:ATP-dependent helicase HrpB n=1 Tax=Dermabacter vaginalis TaxID=1630135 RepID=UPI0021A4600D|nr:ATP-dependent helicase HrpB [Dermabacter vaginalis]MCT2150554.1 ATP-dependent helicase HrpB [Dermabacter vaginalis]
MRSKAKSDGSPATFDLEVIGANLAFASVAADLAEAIASPGASAVVQAPPGSGKTTLVPPIVANALAGDAGSGRVIVTQPRRVAARAGASRLRALASQSTPALADRVAYTVRGDSTFTRDTLVEFVTPGVLVRRLLADPELADVSAIVLDEVHERSLDSDLALAFSLDVRDLRGDLRLLALSATLDAERFAGLMGEGLEYPVPVIDSPTALFPVDTRRAPFAARTNERGVSRDFLAHAARVAVEALEEPGEFADSDVLVFLPGAWEVENSASVARELLASRGIRADVCELHGRIDAREQDRIVRGREAGEPRRLIFSTNLAESSLTVPGVRIVVDSGLSREVRRDAARKMSGLVTVTASRASMTQRAGRAGRLGPGLAIRLFDDLAYAGARDFTLPEIASADLTDTALLMAAWGTPGGSGLRLPDAPPADALADAHASLAALGALDAEGALTPLGRTLASIPADPRLARALLASTPVVGSDAASRTVAALSLEAPLPLDGHLVAGPRAQRDRLHKEADRFARFARRHAESAPRLETALESPKDPAHQVGIVVALAYPERLARRVEPGIYESASGTRAGTNDTALGEWIAIAEVQRSNAKAARGTGAIIRSAAPLTEEEALACAGPLVRDSTDIDFGENGAKARRVKALGSIVLSSTPTKVEGPGVREAILAGIRRAGLGVFTWSASAANLRARLALLHRELGAPWPDVSDAALLARLEELAGPELDALAGIGRKHPAAPSAIDMRPILERALPWPEASRLDELVTERVQVPSGSKIRLDYPSAEQIAHAGEGDTDEAPVRLKVKLQEMFGLEETPRIVDGRVSLLIELLSPGGKTLAITKDLRSFWAGPYADVRKDMRGRYPKHPWPEDPMTFEATAKTNRALRRGAK